MSDEETTSKSETKHSEPTSNLKPDPNSQLKAKIAIESLSTFISKIPPFITSSHSLLHNPEIFSHISSLIRQPDSGSGNNNLCRWLYDTFQSTDPGLQLVVLCFIPIISGVYLTRVSLHRPLAGFEAVLLAVYAHETASRAGQPLTVNIPDLNHPSIYHECKEHMKNNSTSLNLSVVSPTLEPHGTVRSTRRGRIVGVALELYYSKIYQMPIESKIGCCEFFRVWAGEELDMYDEIEEDTESKLSRLEGANNDGANKERKGKEGRILLPWELLQPILRILGHCLMGCEGKNEQVFDAASSACRSLYARAMHDINPKAILGTRSLLRLGKMGLEPKDDFDPSEIPSTKVLSL